MLEVRLSDIVAQLGGEFVGDAATVVDRLGPLDTATPTTVGFIANPRYRSQLAASAAGCVIVAPALREEAAARGATIVTPEPYLYYARLTQWWAARSRPAEPGGVHPTAVVEPGADIHPSAHVAALAFVGAGARLAEGVVVAAQAHVGRHAAIGAHSRLGARSVVGEGCLIGERCILQPGAIIGADGFGFAPSPDGWQKIEQLGIVRIGDDVEVGANTCIDRGALDDTVVEDGVKLDNLIQIAHNVHIGRHTVMAGCSAVAGSARIGAYCQIGGAARILGHLQLVDHVVISVATVVTRSILQPGQYSGAFPFDDNARWEKNAATLRHLHDLRGRLRALEKKTAGPT